MQSTRKSLSKKVVSFFMAFLILALSAPVAFAAEPNVLTKDNVTEWPTAVYKDGGKLYLGQKDGDVVSWEGGTVVYNGTVVPGHFEFIDPDTIQTLCGNVRANLKFVPDNLAVYTGFEATRLRQVTYTVSEIPIVFVDEVNDPLVATEVEPGASLSTSTLSGGKVKNLILENDPKLNGITWQWVVPSTTVNESGLYEAIFNGGSGYEALRAQVQVNVKSLIPETSIVEYPTVPELTYNPNMTWSDITLSGGKAVIKGTETVVNGKFEFKNDIINAVPNTTTTEINIVFTPTNSEEALPYEFSIPVKVNPIPISFKDADGNPITGEYVFEVEPNESMRQVLSLIDDYIFAPEGTSFSIEDNNGWAKDGRKYKITLFYDSSNFTGTELYFTAKFKQTEFVPRFYAIGDGKWKVDCDKYSPPGVFTVYSIFNGVETEIGKIKENEILEWKPQATGTYTFKVEYTKAETDYFIINEVTTYPKEHNPDRYFSATGTESTAYKMGATVTAVAPATDPDPALSAKPYYGFAGWEIVSGNPELSAEELASPEISFAMPDENVELKANYEFNFILFVKHIFATVASWFKGIFESIGTLI